MSREVAKIFMNGRSQAVRLPVEYRFDCKEVYIRKDPTTGDVIISKRPSNWQEFFEMASDTLIPDDFLAERDNDVLLERDLF